jgi:hypothetical protein
MGFYTGRTGSLVFNSKPVAKVRDWSIETSFELLLINVPDTGAIFYNILCIASKKERASSCS